MRKFTGERETIGALGFVTHVVYEMRNLETFMERGSSAITNLGFVKSICGLLGSVDARDSESPRHFAKCTQPGTDSFQDTSISRNASDDRCIES